MLTDFENEQNAAAAADVISDVEAAELNKNSEKGVSYMKWTDEMLFYFVKECRNQKVHKSEESKTMEQKWQFVLAALKKSPLFIQIETNKLSALRKKLSDEKKRCKTQYGISEACINLSWLSSKPNDTDCILLDMITDQNTKNLNAKRKRKQSEKL